VGKSAHVSKAFEEAGGIKKPAQAWLNLSWKPLNQS
jgi:hypothetical protein